MKGIVFQGQSQYDVLRTYSSFYTQKLQEYGVEAITCDMNLVDADMYLNIVDKFNPDFTFGFNPVCYSYDNDSLHFQKTEVPHIVRLGDNPYYHMFNRALSNPNDQMVYTLTTQTSFEYSFKSLGVERYSIIKHTPAEQHYKVNFKNKIYPTVFFGSYVEPEKILLSLKGSGHSNRIYQIVKDFCLMIKNFVVEEESILNEPIEIYFFDYLTREYHLRDEQIVLLTKNVFYYIDHYYRNLIRQKVLLTFANHNVEMFVFGNEDIYGLLGEFKNVKVFNPVNYNDYINILAHSKAAVNITPIFKSDHERISTTLFNSTLLCSNIMGDLIEGIPSILESALFYNLSNLEETATILNDILNDEEEYNEIIEKGLKVASKHLTFEEDINNLLYIVKNKFN